MFGAGHHRKLRVPVLGGDVLGEDGAIIPLVSISFLLCCHLLLQIGGTRGHNLSGLVTRRDCSQTKYKYQRSRASWTYVYSKVMNLTDGFVL